MEKNGQHSQDNMSSSDQDRRRVNGGGRYRESNDPNTPYRVQKQRSKTAAVAIGVLVVITLGLVGFEVMTRLAPQHAEQLVKGSKSLLILSQEKEKEGAGLITNAPHWHMKEDEDYIAVIEANKVQSNKIKALKQQIADANQKLHEVKSHLFTKGNPTDRARLAEICQELVEKERQGNELRERLSVLESEKAQNLDKIKRMEQTIDALAVMTDTQRETKEQAILTFQAQIEQLQNSSREQQRELQRTIEDLEDSQIELKEILAQKLTTIKNLEDEVSWQYNQLEERNRDIKSQAQLYSSSEKNLNKQLQDLVVAMELEHLQYTNLSTELDVSRAKQGAQQQYTLSLEERLHNTHEKSRLDSERNTNSQLAITREYLDLQGLLDVYANTHTHFDNKQKKLSQLVKEEKTRADKLQKDLENVVANFDQEQQRSFCLEEELNVTAYKAQNLQEEVERQQATLDRTQQEVEMLTFTNASLKDQLQEKVGQLTASLQESQGHLKTRDGLIRELTINLELEKTRAQELNYHLKETLADHHNQLEHAKVLEQELSLKSEILAAVEDRLQDKQREINELKIQNTAMTSNFEQEKLRSQELHKALVFALEENDADQFQIRQLKGLIDENGDALALLQDRMSDKKQIMSEMQERLDEITKTLTIEKIKNDELQRDMTLAIAARDTEHGRVVSLEADLTHNSRKLLSLQDSLADKQQEIRGLLEKVQKMNNELELETSRAQDLQNDLNSALSNHDNQFFRSQSLENTVEEKERHITGLIDQLDKLTTRFENEKTRSGEIEKTLFAVMSKLDDKEKILDEIMADNKITEEEFGTLQHEIQRLRDERDMLEKQNKQQLALLLNQQELLRKLTTDMQNNQDVADELERNAEMLQQESGTVDEYPDFSLQKTRELPRGITHIVSEGDTLSSLSLYYYGNPNKSDDIFNANRSLLRNKNDTLQSGTRLFIPR